MSGHVAPPIYEYNDEVISDEFFLDESDILHELSMDDEDLPDVDDDSETEHVEEVDDAIDTFKSHNGELYAVACSPTDATLVATGGGDDRGFLWKIGEKGDWVSELQGHKDSVSSLAFSYDGQFLASGCFHGIVQVWDAYGNLKNVFEGLGGGIEWLRWHPRQRTLLAGSEDFNVWIWNATDRITPPYLLCWSSWQCDLW